MSCVSLYALCKFCAIQRGVSALFIIEKVAFSSTFICIFLSVCAVIRKFYEQKLMCGKCKPKIYFFPFFFPIKFLGSQLQNRVGRETGSTTIIFFGLMYAQGSVNVFT